MCIRDSLEERPRPAEVVEGALGILELQLGPPQVVADQRFLTGPPRRRKHAVGRVSQRSPLPGHRQLLEMIQSRIGGGPPDWAVRSPAPVDDEERNRLSGALRDVLQRAHRGTSLAGLHQMDGRPADFAVRHLLQGEPGFQPGLPNTPRADVHAREMGAPSGLLDSTSPHKT